MRRDKVAEQSLLVQSRSFYGEYIEGIGGGGFSGSSSGGSSYCSGGSGGLFIEGGGDDDLVNESCGRSVR